MLTAENGYLVDYDNLHTALRAVDKKSVIGHRVFDVKDRQLAGILDEEKLAIWCVDEETLQCVKEGE